MIRESRPPRRSPRHRPEPDPVDLNHMRAVRRFVARYSELLERRDNAKGENALLTVIAEMQRMERTIHFVPEVPAA